MVVFNSSVLENWKSMGYKYIYILPLKKYGVLHPLKQEKNNKKGYTIQTQEFDLINMSDNYFFVKNKDAVHQFAQV